MYRESWIYIYIYIYIYMLAGAVAPSAEKRALVIRIPGFWKPGFWEHVFFRGALKYKDSTGTGPNE